MGITFRWPAAARHRLHRRQVPQARRRTATQRPPAAGPGQHGSARHDALEVPPLRGHNPQCTAVPLPRSEKRHRGGGSSARSRWASLQMKRVDGVLHAATGGRPCHDVTGRHVTRRQELPHRPKTAALTACLKSVPWGSGQGLDMAWDLRFRHASTTSPHQRHLTNSAGTARNAHGTSHYVLRLADPIRAARLCEILVKSWHLFNSGVAPG